MRIIKADEFMRMPVGTVYSKYEPCIIGQFFIKDTTIQDGKGENIDFFYQDISDAIDCNGSDEFFEKLDESEKTGCDIAMDFDCLSRDGCFEPEQLYAVWSKEDVSKLIARLQEANK